MGNKMVLNYISEKRTLPLPQIFYSSGEHCHSSDDLYKVNLAETVNLFPIRIKEDQYAYKYLKRFYKYGRDSGLRHRIKIFIKAGYLYKVYAKYRYNL